MRRISVPLYAPILVMVIVVALVNVGGVALSRDRGNRGETPFFFTTRFIPAGTPGERIDVLLAGNSTTLPCGELQKTGAFEPGYQRGRVTIVGEGEADGRPTPRRRGTPRLGRGV